LGISLNGIDVGEMLPASPASHPEAECAVGGCGHANSFVYASVTVPPLYHDAVVPSTWGELGDVELPHAAATMIAGAMIAGATTRRSLISLPL